MCLWSQAYLERAIPLLGEMPEEALHGVATRCALRSYKEGQVMAKAGEPGETFFLVIEGGVQHCKGDMSGGDGNGPLGPHTRGSILRPSQLSSISQPAGLQKEGWFYGEVSFLRNGWANWESSLVARGKGTGRAKMGA